MEREGYIPPGTMARNYKEADEMARALVRKALEKTPVEPVLDMDDEWERRRQEAMGDQEEGPAFPDMDAEDAAEAELERRAIMEEAGISPAAMDALDDNAIPFDGQGSTDRVAAMRALGFTDEEIASDGQDPTAAPGQPQAPRAETQEPGEVRPPDEPGSPAQGPEGEAFDLTSQTEEQLRLIAEREAAARRADEAEQRRLADKAKADAQLDEFVLTGSNRPADVAAAAGQTGLFDAPVRDDNTVGLRKRLAILKQLRECLQS